MVKMISEWDGDMSLFKDKDKKNFLDLERFINHIQFFQHIFNYFSVGQGELAKSLEDTVGRKKKDKREKRDLKKEYSIAACFTLKQLTDLLDRKDVIRESRLILVSSHNHDTAIFKKDGKYYYFDPNSNKGEV